MLIHVLCFCFDHIPHPTSVLVIYFHLTNHSQTFQLEGSGAWEQFRRCFSSESQAAVAMLTGAGIMGSETPLLSSVLHGRSVSCYSVKYEELTEPLLLTQASWSQFEKPHLEGGKEMQSSQLAEGGAVWTSSGADGCLQGPAVPKPHYCSQHLVFPVVYKRPLDPKPTCRKAHPN